MNVQSQINYFSATGVVEADCIVGSQAVSSLLPGVLATLFFSQGEGVGPWQNNNRMLVNFNDLFLAESNNLLTHIIILYVITVCHSLFMRRDNLWCKMIASVQVRFVSVQKLYFSPFTKIEYYNIAD